MKASYNANDEGATLVVNFSFGDVALLNAIAADRQHDVGHILKWRLQYLLDDQQLFERLDPPDGNYALDGDRADAFGAQAIQRVASTRGITIEVIGGKHHDGKVFQPLIAQDAQV